LKVFSKWCDFLRVRLIQSDPLEKADLIVVLAGHRNRKVFGALLFGDGWAPSVLMSTGDPPYIARVLEKEVGASVARDKHVWSQVHQAALPSAPRQGHFFARLDDAGWSVHSISVGWFGTLSEMEALADWLRQHPSIRSLLIVSAGYHLTRVRICCRRLLPEDRKVRLIAVTMHATDLAARKEGPEPEGCGRILLEWGKVLLYEILLLVVRSKWRRPAGSAA